MRVEGGEMNPKNSVRICAMRTTESVRSTYGLHECTDKTLKLCSNKQQENEASNGRVFDAHVLLISGQQISGKRFYSKSKKVDSVDHLPHSVQLCMHRVEVNRPTSLPSHPSRSEVTSRVAWRTQRSPSSAWQQTFHRKYLARMLRPSSLRKTSSTSLPGPSSTVAGGSPLVRAETRIVQSCEPNTTRPPTIATKLTT